MGYNAYLEALADVLMVNPFRQQNSGDYLSNMLTSLPLDYTLPNLISAYNEPKTSQALTGLMQGAANEMVEREHSPSFVNAMLSNNKPASFRRPARLEAINVNTDPRFRAPQPPAGFKSTPHNGYGRR